MKTVVVYKSRYGSTGKYAHWIAEETGGDIFEASSVNGDVLGDYDVIIYGGSLHALGIVGFSVIKRNFERIKDKKLIVFSVGMSPAYPEAMEEVKKNNFTPAMTGKIEYFHLRGGFNFKKLNLMDKVLMFMMKQKIRINGRKRPLTNDEKGMLAAYKGPIDWTKKSSIEPILKSLNEFSKIMGG